MRARLGWLWRSPLGLLGAVVVCGVLCSAALAPWLAPYAREDRDLRDQLSPPSAAHWLGTGEGGEDLLTEIIYGARVAVLVGGGSVAVCALLGVALGAVAGFAGGRVDDALMRLTEVLLSFPGILLAILIIFITQEPSTWTVVLAISVTGWASYARLVRGQVLLERRKEYVEAARALGLPWWRVLFVHVVPNVMSPVLVQATFGVAGGILAEASLSFLGLGPQGTPSWGALLDQGAQYFLLSQHIALFPGLAIMVTVLGVNFLGEALRDHLDPRSGAHH
jgi:peptide/nickel transport system permease protein